MCWQQGSVMAKSTGRGLLLSRTRGLLLQLPFERHSAPSAGSCVEQGAQVFPAQCETHASEATWSWLVLRSLWSAQPCRVGSNCAIRQEASVNGLLTLTCH